jgi:hypothetical protein
MAAASALKVSLLRCAIVGLAGLLATNGAMADPRPVTQMEEPLAGDYWTYEIRDEITGTISATRKNVVTEATPAEISVRFSIQGTPNGGFNVYDRSWNLISNGPWKYSPNDGSGIRTPLEVGKTWSFQSNDVNAGNANIVKRSGTS